MRSTVKGFRLLRRHGSRRTRRGAAIVEMAVVAPLLLTLLFGVMEFGWLFMVHETMTNSARECCRLASLQGVSDADIRTRFAESMEGTGIAVTTGMLTITHSTEGTAEVVTIQIQVPYSQVSITGLSSFLGISTNQLTSVCSMRKESTL
jgi:Flp pilus assembly protein TadG